MVAGTLGIDRFGLLLETTTPSMLLPGRFWVENACPHLTLVETAYRAEA